MPKWKIADIDIDPAEAIEAAEKGKPKRAAWFERLKPYFDEKIRAGLETAARDVLEGI